MPTVRPSVTVATSPGNFQFWFFFKEAIDVKTAKRLGERIRHATRSDSDTGNPVQPYRVAGTTNYPSKAKIERGRVVVPTQLDEFDIEALETPDTIEAAFPSRNRLAEPAAANGGDGEPIELDEASIPGETLRVIREGVEDPDRSDVFFNVVRTLKEDGWTVDGIAALLERYPRGIARKYRGRIRREVERVYSKIRIKPRQLVPASASETGGPPPENPPSTSPAAGAARRKQTAAAARLRTFIGRGASPAAGPWPSSATIGIEAAHDSSNVGLARITTRMCSMRCSRPPPPSG